MLRLLTDAEVIAKYGDPYKYMDDDGSVASAWGLSILDSFVLPRALPLAWGGSAKRISCHKLVKPALELTFKRLAAIPEVWDTINDYGGCYNFRRIRGAPRQLSRHSWGIAIDLDVKDNPAGSAGEMHGLIVEAFYDIGWKWGGFWTPKDTMHFEAATSC